MKNKRTIGTGKIFLYSCGTVIGLAFIIWLIINVIFAVVLSHERRGRDIYIGEAGDIYTPWLLILTTMFMYYRYWRMCAANNISGRKQTVIFALMSVFAAVAFSMLDILFTKLVLQNIYGGIVCTNIEYESYYLSTVIHDYTASFGNRPVGRSPYSAGTLLMIFAATALYYYCFIVMSFYFMKSIRYRKWKRFIYIAVTIVGMILAIVKYPLFSYMVRSLSGDSVMAVIADKAFMVIVFAMVFSNPVLFMLMSFSFVSRNSNISSFYFYFTAWAVFSLIMYMFTMLLDTGYFPGKRRIRKALENYYTENNTDKGGPENE